MNNVVQIINSLLTPILFHFLFSSILHAQSETFFQKYLNNKSNKMEKEYYSVDKEKSDQYKLKYKWEVNTPSYLIDLNKDGQKEELQFHKKDGEDWFSIKSSKGDEIYKLRMDQIGTQSKLYKIGVYELSENYLLLLLYYFQGNYLSQNFLGSSLVYFLTIDQKNLSSIYTYKGPQIFEEKMQMNQHYHLRYYHTRVEDINGDGIRDVTFIHYKTAHPYFYKGLGLWN